MDPCRTLERCAESSGCSVIVKVLLKKDESVYLNDGMYGSFWELRFNGHKRYPLRVYRDGRPLDGPTRHYRAFGPTCDSTDVLPEPLSLPRDIAAGDYIEVGRIGAYSVSGRTCFNGFGVDSTWRTGTVSSTRERRGRRWRTPSCKTKNF